MGPAMEPVVLQRQDLKTSLVQGQPWHFAEGRNKPKEGTYLLKAA